MTEGERLDAYQLMRVLQAKLPAAAILGRKGGPVTAKRGSAYFRKLRSPPHPSLPSLPPLSRQALGEVEIIEEDVQWGD